MRIDGAVYVNSRVAAGHSRMSCILFFPNPSSESDQGEARVALVVSLEAQNFDMTLYDTNDLSVVRGASLWLDKLEDLCRNVLDECGATDLKRLETGSERVVFSYEGSDEGSIRNGLEASLARDLWPYFHVAVAFADSADTGKARNKSSQLRNWTVRLPDVENSKRPDELDRVRPATTTIQKGDNTRHVSAMTAARLRYGKEERQLFWRANIPEGGRAADSLSDLVADPPSGLPDSAQRKVALVHLDGDKFGKLAAKDPVRFNNDFSAFKSDLLKAVAHQAFDVDKGLLRLEALIWGGDDMTFVMPSWQALEFLSVVQERGKAATMTAAVVIAHHKSPIRQLNRLAGMISEEAKSLDLRGQMLIDVFESAALPEDGPKSHWTRNFGPGVGAAQLAMPMADIKKISDQINDWKSRSDDDLLSRSKLFELLKLPDDGELEYELEKYCLRMGRDVDAIRRRAALSGGERGIRLNLCLMAQLWDYIQVSE